MIRTNYLKTMDRWRYISHYWSDKVPRYLCEPGIVTLNYAYSPFNRWWFIGEVPLPYVNASDIKFNGFKQTYLAVQVYISKRIDSLPQTLIFKYQYLNNPMLKTLDILNFDFCYISNNQSLKYQRFT